MSTELLTLVVAALAFIASMWSAWGTWRAADATKKSIDYSARALQISERAAVSAEAALTLEHKRDTEELSREDVANARRKLQLTPRIELTFLPDRAKWLLLETYIAMGFKAAEGIDGRRFAVQVYHGRISIRNNGREAIDELEVSAPTAEYFAPINASTPLLKDLKPGEVRTYPAAIHVGSAKEVQIQLRAWVLDLDYTMRQSLRLRR